MHVSSISRKGDTVSELQNYTTSTSNGYSAAQENATEASSDSAEDALQLIKKMMLDSTIVQWRNDILTSQPEEQEW